MNVLVTGGAGYIGSHATRRLLLAGHRVVVLDNLSHGHAEALARVNAQAKGVAAGTAAEIIVGDAGDDELVTRTLKNHAIDSVLHFAAFIEVGESVVKPDMYYRNNFVNALSLLQSATRAGVRNFVFSSTAAVYGNPLRTPIEENDLLAPINPYGRSKMMVELALEDFRVAYGLGYTILRYFNVAGASPDGSIGEAHEPESHLIPRLLLAARAESPRVQIYGTDYPTPDGTCIRDYVHVEDLVAAHILALESGSPGTARTYNLGSENGFSVRQVIDVCRAVTGRDLIVEENPKRAGDPAVLVASSAKIRRELAWTPQHASLEEIVTHAWKWHSEHPFGYGAHAKF